MEGKQNKSSCNSEIIQVITHSRFLLEYAKYLTHNYDDAMDLYQETIYRGLHSINNYQELGKARYWLLRIMKNVFINEEHRPLKMFSSPIDEENIKEESEVDGIDTYKTEELYAAIEKLPLKDRRLMLLYIQGYAYEEMAREMDMKVGTIKSRIYRIKKRMRILLSRSF